jgi:alpha-beta hydrolase superfamily lysophospholipase
MRVVQEEGHVTTADSLSLFIQGWSPENPRGAVMVVHGLADHSGRHKELCEFLAGRGFLCQAIDYRGHGKSPGQRAHVRRFSDYQKDLRALDSHTSERYKGPRFFLGHSFGGLLVLDLLLSPSPPDVAGAILSSPLLGIHPDTKPGTPRRLLGQTLSRIWPNVPFPSGLDPSHVSRDPAVVAGYRADPLVSRTVTPRWYTETGEALARVGACAGAVRSPLLVIYAGADRIVDPAATRAFVQRTPRGLVEEHCYPELFHEIFHEPEKAHVLERAAAWLEAASIPR